MFKKIIEMESSIHQILFSIISLSAVIIFWRGLFGLLDTYLFPSNLLLSLWASLTAGAVILIATHYAAKEFV